MSGGEYVRGNVRIVSVILLLGGRQSRISIYTKLTTSCELEVAGGDGHTMTIDHSRLCRCCFAFSCVVYDPTISQRLCVTSAHGMPCT